MRSISLRIVGGSLKGRYVKVSSLDNDLRPTKEFVREAIFSALGSRIDFNGLEVLDLYSGSGALAFESISRGAQLVTCIESSNKNCLGISENSEKLGIKEKCIVTNVNVVKFLDSNKKSYDICFSDPPYGSINLSEFIEKIRKNFILKPGGLLIIEDDKKYLNTWISSSDIISANYEIIFIRDYGITSVAILKLKES